MGEAIRVVETVPAVLEGDDEGCGVAGEGVVGGIGSELGAGESAVFLRGGVGAGVVYVLFVVLEGNALFGVGGDPDDGQDGDRNSQLTRWYWP